MNQLGWLQAKEQMRIDEILEEEENKCICCSCQLVEGCCLECGEVYGD